MDSLIPGYEYDIFISYRQKDNKGDRWVSEFVEALKTELESTFKEEISVYFDINPSDYLLETYDVDESPFTPVFYYTLLNNTRACISIEEIVAKVKVAVGSNNQQKPQFGKIAGLKDEGGTFFFITK